MNLGKAIMDLLDWYWRLSNERCAARNSVIRRGFQPQVFVMENRIVPADYYWRPQVAVMINGIANYLASNVANWRNATGGAYQNAPGEFDKLIMDGQSTRSCTIDVTASDHFAAIVTTGFRV